jgi:transcriptional regulator with XRE-family HTH domain
VPNSLKALRKARGFTLDELAAASGVGASTIGNFENDNSNMSPETLAKVATALQVSLDEVLRAKPDSMGMEARESGPVYGSGAWKDSSIENLEKHLKACVDALRPARDFARLPGLISIREIVSELITREKK